MEKLFRFFEFDRAKIDVEKRSVPIAFSSEFAVNRGGYDEILDHDPSCVDMSRVKDSAPLLVMHDPKDQVGVIESAEICPDRTGRAIVRFGSSARAKEIFQDVVDGIRKHVSVGYERTRAITRAKLADGREAIRFAWTPFEMSIVPVSADPTSGVGRSEQNTPEESKIMSEVITGVITPPAPDVAAITADVRGKELKRYNEINAASAEMVKAFPHAEKKFRDMATEAIGKGTNCDEFNHALLREIPGIRKVEVTDANIGLSDREIGKYSLVRILAAMVNNRPQDAPFELECSVASAKRMGITPQGFLIPSDLMVGTGKRSMNVTSATQGGNFVETILQTPIIELLRAQMVTARLGVQTLSGLQGNIAIPRQTGTSVAYCVTEYEALTESTPAINQLSLTPHRVGAWVGYTKQLLAQSSIDIESFIRNDMMSVLGLKIDKLVLEGAGGVEPTGISATASIGSVTFGAAATWAKVLAFETAVAVGNAESAKMAYATTPAVRASWKAIPMIAASTVPMFLWGSPGMADGSNDGFVNGYRIATTNNISNNGVFFGNWADAILAIWGGGIDVVVDPYTQAKNAIVNITMNTFIDVGVRHAASFVYSADSGAQ